MTDPETAAEWAARQPQASFVATAARLEEEGYTAEEQAESLLALALHMMNEIHGPRAVGQRLYLLAHKFAGEADQIERGTDATSH